MPQGTLSAPLQVTYTNHGTEPLIFGGFGFRRNPDDFFISSDTCHAPVPGGSSCTVQVRFARQAPGARSATLTALTNAADRSDHRADGDGWAAAEEPEGEPRKERQGHLHRQEEGQDHSQGHLQGEAGGQQGKRTRRLAPDASRAHRRPRHRPDSPRPHHPAVSRIVRLHRGRYVLHVAGRRRGTVFVVG